MGTVTGADFRRILGFLHTAMPGTRADPLPRPTLAALTDVIPADFVAYFELRRADRFLIAQSSNLDFRPDPDIDSAILAFGHQNPLRWRNFGPADGLSASRASSATGSSSGSTSTTR